MSVLVLCQNYQKQESDLTNHPEIKGETFKEGTHEIESEVDSENSVRHGANYEKSYVQNTIEGSKQKGENGLETSETFTSPASLGDDPNSNLTAGEKFNETEANTTENISMTIKDSKTSEIVMMTAGNDESTSIIKPTRIPKADENSTIEYLLTTSSFTKASETLETEQNMTKSNEHPVTEPISILEMTENGKETMETFKVNTPAIRKSTDTTESTENDTGATKSFPSEGTTQSNADQPTATISFNVSESTESTNEIEESTNKIEESTNKIEESTNQIEESTNGTEESSDVTEKSSDATEDNLTMDSSTMDSTTIETTPGKIPSKNYQPILIKNTNKHLSHP